MTFFTFIGSLTICSSDGYVSFINFHKDALGTPIDIDKVPITVQNLHRSLYNYTPPAIQLPVKKAVSKDTANANVQKPPSVGSASATAATTAAQMDIVAKSSKKRITPIAVTVASPALGNTSSEATSNSESKSPSEILNAIASSSSTVTSPVATKKRRITPVLVSITNNALPIDSSSSVNVSSSVSGVSVNCDNDAVSGNLAAEVEDNSNTAATVEVQ